jgi:hypothetical protein
MVATIVVLGFWLILFPIELIIVLIALPFGAIFMSRYELKTLGLEVFQILFDKLGTMFQTFGGG